MPTVRFFPAFVPTCGGGGGGVQGLGILGIPLARVFLVCWGPLSWRKLLPWKFPPHWSLIASSCTNLRMEAPMLQQDLLRRPGFGVYGQGETSRGSGSLLPGQANFSFLVDILYPTPRRVGGLVVD